VQTNVIRSQQPVAAFTAAWLRSLLGGKWARDHVRSIDETGFSGAASP
jgi:hypothetical protein